MAGLRWSGRGTRRAWRNAPSTHNWPLAIAREAGAADLEAFALGLLGRAEVSAGRRQEGMELLEEAMAAASPGPFAHVHTLGEAYCNLIMACTSAGEWDRAAEWCEVVDDFARMDQDRRGDPRINLALRHKNY